MTDLGKDFGADSLAGCDGRVSGRAECDCADNLLAAGAMAPIKGYMAFGPPGEDDFFAFLPPLATRNGPRRSPRHAISAFRLRLPKRGPLYHASIVGLKHVHRPFLLSLFFY